MLSTPEHKKPKSPERFEQSCEEDQRSAGTIGRTKRRPTSTNRDNTRTTFRFLRHWPAHTHIDRNPVHALTTSTPSGVAIRIIVWIVVVGLNITVDADEGGKWRLHHALDNMKDPRRITIPLRETWRASLATSIFTWPLPHAYGCDKDIGHCQSHCGEIREGCEQADTLLEDRMARRLELKRSMVNMRRNARAMHISCQRNASGPVTLRGTLDDQRFRRGCGWRTTAQSLNPLTKKPQKNFKPRKKRPALSPKERVSSHVS